MYFGPVGEMGCYPPLKCEGAFPLLFTGSNELPLPLLLVTLDPAHGNRKLLRAYYTFYSNSKRDIELQL